MKRPTLPYLQAKKRGDATHWYYRRGKTYQRIEGEPWSPEFIARYNRIHESFQAAPTGPAAGSLDALITAYLSSPDYERLAASSRQTYRTYADQLRQAIGKAMVRDLETADIYEVQDALAHRPAKANVVIAVLRAVLAYGAKRRWLALNPAIGVKPLPTDGEHKPWPPALLERAASELTGPARRDFFLGLYTGQRVSDTVRMGPRDIENGGILVTQQKTGTDLWIPLHPNLSAEMATWVLHGLTWVTDETGRRISAKSMTRRWRVVLKNMGVEGYVRHGLRKNAAVALVEAGTTDKQAQAITGHASGAVFARYAKAARQKRLARAAMDKWGTASGNGSGNEGAEDGE